MRIRYVFHEFKIWSADLPTVPKFPYFVLESSSIIRQYDLSDFVTEIRKFWVYDVKDMREIWINEKSNMYPA